MKNKKTRVFWAGLLCMLCLVQGMPAKAECVPFERETGSVEIVLEDEGERIPDIAFELYRTTETALDGTELCCTVLPNFKDCGIDVCDVRADHTAEHLAAFADYHGLIPDAKSESSSGSVRFENLPTGIYLAIPRGSCAAKTAPFMILLPTKDENGIWLFDIRILPKLLPDESCGELTVEKQWKDDAETRPDHVTVWLMKNGIKADEAVLNEASAWKHQWKNLDRHAYWFVTEVDVPNGYTVQYHTEKERTVITNTAPVCPVPPFIQTGQLKWPVPILFILGLILLWCAQKNKKEKNRQKK